MLFTCAARRASSSSTRVVRSRKGRSLRVDIHCHYLNPDVAAKLGPLDPKMRDPLFVFSNSATREVNARQVRERAPKLSDIGVRLKDMDRMGIDVQAISPAPTQLVYWTDAGMGAEIARMVNDRLAAIVSAHPDRFVALGSVPLQDAGLAVAELERCMQQLGMRGVEIVPNVNGTELTAPRLGLEKFFARAEELGAVLFMHPLGFTQGERLSDHYFNNIIGNPLETTVAASHLIFDGVMERHPKLKVVLPHAGGFLAHYWARMDHAHAARPDCCSVIRKRPSSYLKKMYFDTIAFDPRMLRLMVDQYGASHVLLGTDYPYDMAETDPVGLVGKIPRLGRAERSRIEGGNAAKLLNIRRKP